MLKKSQERIYILLLCFLTVCATWVCWSLLTGRRATSLELVDPVDIDRLLKSVEYLALLNEYTIPDISEQCDFRAVIAQSPTLASLAKEAGRLGVDVLATDVAVSNLDTTDLPILMQTGQGPAVVEESKGSLVRVLRHPYLAYWIATSKVWGASRRKTVLSMPGAPRLKQNNHPRIVVAPAPLINLGVVEKNSVAQQHFTIRNEGGRQLRIHDVRPTCGCTSLTMSQRVLAPGESAELTVTFNSRGANGPFIHHVWIRSNDPFTGLAAVGVRGEVVLDQVAVPSVCQFGDILVGESATKRLRLVRASEDVKIKRVAVSHPSLTASVVYSNEVPWVVIQVQSQHLSEDVRGVVTIETDYARQKSLHIPVSASVVPDLQVIPSSVCLGFVDNERPASKPIAMRSRSGKKLSLVSVTPASSDWTIEVGQRDVEGEIHAVCLLTPNGQIGQLASSIAVVASDELGERSTVDIPVYAFARQQP